MVTCLTLECRRCRWCVAAAMVVRASESVRRFGRMVWDGMVPDSGKDTLKILSWYLVM